MKEPLIKRLAGEAAVYALAIVGAVVAYALHLPLALLIGPILVVMPAAQAWHRLNVSPLPYAVALMVIGVALGQYFTPDVVSTWAEIGATLMLNSVATLLVTGMGFMFLRKQFQFDPATAAFAGLPGGILTVMEVSRESTADAGAVLFFQVFRIVLGATIIPLSYNLAGFDIPVSGVQPQTATNPFQWRDLLLLGPGSVAIAIIGRRLRFPSAEISLPLLWSATLYGTGQVTMTIPLWLPAVSFVIVGAAIGTLLPRPKLPDLIRMAAQTLMLFMLFMAATVTVALIAHRLLALDMATGILAFSPASLTEMIAVSVALDLDPALVAANNMFRMIFCSLLAPLLLVGLRRLYPDAQRAPQ